MSSSHPSKCCWLRIFSSTPTIVAFACEGLGHFKVSRHSLGTLNDLWVLEVRFSLQPINLSNSGYEHPGILSIGLLIKHFCFSIDPDYNSNWTILLTGFSPIQVLTSIAASSHFQIKQFLCHGRNGVWFKIKNIPDTVRELLVGFRKKSRLHDVNPATGLSIALHFPESIWFERKKYVG